MSSEALRLADWLQGAVATYPQVSECEPGGYCSELDQRLDEAVTMLRTQAARIAELEAEVDRLRKPLSPERAWQLWAEACKVERPTVDLVEAFARAIEAAKWGK